MTFRLVALMSIVLLLSLAAFGLLVNHYQHQVMEELGRTVSSVGRATLRTLESHQSQAATGPHRAGDVGAWVAGDADYEFRHVAGQHETRVIRWAPGPMVCDDEAEGPGEVALGNHFIIDVADVRTESAPGGAMVMKIPSFTPDPSGGTAQVRVELISQSEDGGEVVYARREEIELPVPVAVYDDLFEKMRSRSLLVFLEVFAVGTVLSTGLATRFTRPIRELDAGIRRVSAGDLNVRVPARGRNEIGRLAHAVNDMTRRLRANEERSREMVRRDKLTALGRLAAGVAHDVRNPLHSIGLTLQHLSEIARPGVPDERDEFDAAVNIIRAEIRRLDQLVGNFLNFARSDRGDRSRVDLAAVLHEIVQLVGKEAQRLGIEIRLQVPGDPPEIEAGGESLRSAILNLVLNSFEAMPDGGWLRLRLEHDDERRELCLEVADNGAGIAQEHHDHVFDFAYTTRDAGNGLGLAMVHHCVVEDHGGRVSLESAPGEGTRVRLFLPLGAEVTG